MNNGSKMLGWLELPGKRMGAARQSWTCCWTVGRERTLSHTWTLVSFPWNPEPDLSVSVDPRVTCPWLGREAPTPYASRLSPISPSEMRVRVPLTPDQVTATWCQPPSDTGTYLGNWKKITRKNEEARKSKMSPGGRNEVHIGLPCGRQK